MKSAGLTLYIKELRSSRRDNLYGPVAFVGALVMLYILAVRDIIPDPVPVAVAFAPLGFWPILAIVAGVGSLQSEWKSRTIYLVNTLPVPGWKILASKLAAIMTSFALVSIIGVGGGLLLVNQLMGADFAEVFRYFSALEIAKTGLIFCFLYVLMIVALVVISQLAYLTSTLVDRFGWVLFGLTFFTSFWFIGRVGYFLSLPFQWVPRLYAASFTIENGIPMSNPIGIDTSALIGCVLTVFILFIVGAHILEKDSEV